MLPTYKHGVLIHNYHEDQHGTWNLKYQATKPEMPTPFPVSKVAYDWKGYSKTGPDPKLPSKDTLSSYLFFGHAGNVNEPIKEFKSSEYYPGAGYFFRDPAHIPEHLIENPAVDSFLDGPDPAGATLRKASSTARLVLENRRLKMGREADSYETTNRAELYGSHLPMRRSPSCPTALHRIDPMTDPRRFSHDADAGWRRIGFRSK